MARPKSFIISPEDLRDLYINQKMTVPRIATLLGYSQGTIQSRLAEFAIKLGRNRNDLELPVEEVRSMYLEQNLNMVQICKHFKCSKSTVRQCIVHGGFLKEKQIHKKWRKFTLPSEQLFNLYITQNMSDVAIGRQLDVSHMTVANWRKRFGIFREAPINAITLDADELKRLYIEDKRTFAELAEHFNCGVSTVRSHIIRAGLNIDAPELAVKKIFRNKQKYTYRQICDGYRLIKMAGHPSANGDGYVREHRYVAECAMGRYLEFNEQVHHINCEKLDNRIENLAVIKGREDHARLHKYMERGLVYLLGITDKRPGPLVFANPCFWAGKWVTEIDLLPPLT